MINQARAAAMLPAQDLERAKAFYRDKLGLTPTMESPGAIFYQLAGGTAFVAYPSSGQSSGTYTQLALEVQDFDGTVKALRSKGVKVEDYDTPMVKTVDGVAEAGPGMKIAWFKDSEGNLIAVAPPVPVPAAKGACPTPCDPASMRARRRDGRRARVARPAPPPASRGSREPAPVPESRRWGAASTAVRWPG